MPINLKVRDTRKSHYRIQAETKQEIKANPFASGKFVKEMFSIAQVFGN